MDVSKQHPEVSSRLKRQMLEINASVMAEAPGWGSVGGTPTSSSSHPDPPKELNSSNAEILARIDRNELPEGCRAGEGHQDYVDRRMADLSSRQRARIGQLWKEKQRIDPNMANRGFSFVKIMEFVAEHEKPRNTNRREETVK